MNEESAPFNSRRQGTHNYCFRRRRVSSGRLKHHKRRLVRPAVLILWSADHQWSATIDLMVREQSLNF